MILAFRPLIGIIVGVIIALTVVAAGLVVVLRCRSNNRNRQNKREYIEHPPVGHESDWVTKTCS